MTKRLAATIIIAIFLLSTVAILNPVSATFTLGDMTGTYRYHANDFDPHVPGVIGYVWPGGGQNTWGGVPNYANVNNAPGYQSPYPGQKPPATPGSNQFGNAPSSSWYQLEGDAYAPFGAVLTGSTGDLIFALNATYGYGSSPAPLCLGNGNGARCRWSGIELALPPGFTVPGPEQVVTSFTNDYSGIWVDKIGPYDRYVPGWTVITMFADAGCSGQGSASTACTGAASKVYYNHQYIDFTSAGEWYYIRINGVTAPTVAGRYFFKVLLYGDSDIVGQAATGEAFTRFIPVENWPVMLVKGEIDPAIITGTIRYAGYNQTLYGQPVQEAGTVYATMTMRLDPYTGEQRPDLPTVDAVSYFNATAQGHFELEGLAPGIYDIYASAAGYPKTLIETGITVLKGQSLHFDGYLQPGAVIHGNVFTKHQFGDEPWPSNTYIKIELYDGYTLTHQPDPSALMVSWSPLPCVAGGQEAYYGRRHAGLCADPRLGDNIAFPWHEYKPANGYFAGASAAAYSFFQTSTGLNQATFQDDGSQFNKQTQDPEGVGPPQHWFVQGGTTIPFHFEFGVKGEYGAPRDLSGMVPQVFATWVNGLTPGRYFARAWVFRYVQAALDGSTFQEYYFDVTPNEWAGDVTLPIDLRLSSWVNKTVHFHNVINGITEDPIDTGAGFMAGYLMDANGVVYSYNQTALAYRGQYSKGAAKGAWNVPGSGGQQPTTCYGGTKIVQAASGMCGNDLDKAKLNQHAIETGRANIQFAGLNDTWGGENYGIPSGTYTPYVYTLGYIESSPMELVSVTLSGNPTSISDHVYRGAGFNVTVYSIDWERPRVSRNWVWGQWGIGYGPDNPPAIGTCNVPANPATPNTWCSGQQPYPWGAGWSPYKTGNPPWSSYGYGTPSNNLGVGQEIDVGFYQNGTMIDFLSDEAQASGPAAALASTILTDSLYQNDTATWVEANGGGWNPLYLDPASQQYVQYDGNANHAFFGQELKRSGFIGGYGDGRFVFMKGKNLLAKTFFVRPIQQEPTALPGGQYDLRAFTYGYVQDKEYSVFVEQSQVADNKINLIIGVNVTLDILFKKEHIITPTSDNMSARVRLFDDSGNLVAEWMSSEGTYSTKNGFARAADGTTQYPFGPTHPNVPFPLPLNSYNFLPGGTTELHVLMAGLPQVPPDGQEAPDLKPKGTYFGDPLLTVARSQCGFELNCYKNPGVNWNAPGFYPNSGILGAPDYQGGWTAEVDFVNWYANNTGPDCFEGIGATTNTCTPNTVPNIVSLVPSSYVPPNTFLPPKVVVNTGTAMSPFTSVLQQTPNYYPPVAGLLMGESYHLVPGTTATSGISLTEDMALTSPPGVGHSMAANHLGPYSQEGVWQISNAHDSGEASAIFEVDLNGLVTGNALAFTWSNEFRPLSWGLVNVVGAQGGAGWNFYTYDGVYQAYLPPGTYQFTMSSPGYASQSWSVAVSSGMNGGGQNLYLEQSNIPVPEFSGLAIAAVSALAASLYVLRRRRN